MQTNTMLFKDGFYGRSELVRLYERYWLTGFVIAVAGHLLLISLLPTTNNDSENKVREPRRRGVVGVYPLPPPIINPPTGREGGNTNRPGDFISGNIVPAPFQEKDYATQEEMGQPYNPHALPEGIGTAAELAGWFEPTTPAEITVADAWLVEKMPMVVTSVKPEYPELAIKASIEGVVWMKILVDTTGQPARLEVLRSTHQIFEQAAINASSRFLFTPGYMSRGPVNVWVSIPFRFELKK